MLALVKERRDASVLTYAGSIGIVVSGTAEVAAKAGSECREPSAKGEGPLI